LDLPLEGLPQEIAGEFARHSAVVQKQQDESCRVGGGGRRELNRITGWALPTEGPKTLSGLIIKYFETIPQPGTSLKPLDHPL
jgi:Mg2+/Co2+ transporter CorB